MACRWAECLALQPARRVPEHVAPSVIVSYDGTDNDRDALALGRVLAGAGAELSLAYVRHSHDPDPGREAELQAEAEELLAEGAAVLGNGVATHVVISPATGAGLAALAEDTDASMIVFGSEYRTSPGHVAPGTSAMGLLHGGPVAVAIAPAGLRENEAFTPKILGEVSEAGDLSARETAWSLANALGGEMAPAIDTEIDMLVIGSQAAAAPGRVALSAAAHYVLETARCPVLAVPRGGRVRFSG
jgi:nucleotide-binding universal stress UspA family protein